MSEEPIKIFIGSSANGEDAEAEMVYEYSLRKHASQPLEIYWMRQTHDPESYWYGWNTGNWPTPFSGFRWAIPEVCDFKGRAIYTDEDMINLHDIVDLWNTPLGDGKALAAKAGTRFGGHEFCVMLFDCEKVQPHMMKYDRLIDQSYGHQRMIANMTQNPIVQDLDPRWNNFDGEDLAIDEIYQLHYTKMATQPWKPSWYKGIGEEHPRQDIVDIWFEYKQEALDAGWTPNIPTDEEKFGTYNIIGK